MFLPKSALLTLLLAFSATACQAAMPQKTSAQHAPVKNKTHTTPKTSKPVKKTAEAKKKPAPKVVYDVAAAQGIAASVNYKPNPALPYYKQFEDYVRTVIAPRVPGAALAIIVNGQVSVLNGYGVRKQGAPEPVTPDTVFRLASVSKTLASGSAAILVRDKLLSWDTPVTSKVKSLEFSNRFYGNQLTLRHVLSQSTGLPKHTYTHLIEEHLPYPTILERLKYVDFTCPPSKCYSYQNIVYSLSGDMIKAVSGKSYEAFTQEKLFRPLGMLTASFGEAAFLAAPNKAMPHTWRTSGWKEALDGDHNYYSVGPAAGANASIRDLSQWVLAQLGHKQEVLPEYLLDQIQQKVTKNTLGDSHYMDRSDITNTAYGLGWRVFDFGKHKNFAHHGGWVQGYRAEVVFNRDLQMGMAFLTNSETKLARNIIFKYLDFFQDSQGGNKGLVKR